MSGWQLLGLVLFAGPILTLLFWGLFFHTRDTWARAVIWRTFVCIVVLGVIELGLYLMLGRLP